MPILFTNDKQKFNIIMTISLLNMFMCRFVFVLTKKMY